MRQRKGLWFSGFLASVTILSLAGCGTAGTANNTANTVSSTAGGGGTVINEQGSSLVYPLFVSQWIPAYHKKASGVRINAASTGSGAGISHAIDGTSQIGASDAYMSPADLQTNPGMLNIPLAISAQQVMYHLPGLTKNQHLQLTGTVLAQIYQGNIKYWDDVRLTRLNPGVTLPHQLILPVYRSDGSGDTFLFTQFLSDTNATWRKNPGYGTSVSWPAVTNAIGAKGNSGIVEALAMHKYSLSYVGVSWLDKAVARRLGYAALQNRAGRFVLPTTANIQSAANAMTKRVPANEAISLIYAPGATSYPIINFEYAIVNTKQSSAQVGQTVRSFLLWAIDPAGGNTAAYLSPVHFLPLPGNIEALSRTQIRKIGG